MFEEVEPVDIILDQQAYRGAFTHTIDVGLWGIELLPTIGYNLSEDFKIELGPNFTLPIGGTYDQKEEISDPGNRGTFIDPDTGEDSGMRTRNEADGDFDDLASILPSIDLGLSYKFPMNQEGTLWLAPEIFGSYIFSSPIDDDNIDWSIITLRGGVSLRYVFDSPEESIPSIDTIIKRDTTILFVENPKGIYLANEDSELDNDRFIISQAWISEKQKEMVVEKTEELPDKSISTGIRAVGIDQNGNEKEFANIILQEYVSTEIKPLLPYVFFDQNSASLKSRYSGISSNYSDIHAPEIYYNILDTVAKRLIISGKDIVLTGRFIDGENQQLGLQRAENVKRMLVQKGVIADNISIESKSADAREGDEFSLRQNELRRVEFKSDTREVERNIAFIRDTIKLSNPPSIKLYIEDAIDRAENWELNIYNQTDEVIRNFNGRGAPPESLIWNIERENVDIAAESGTLKVVLETELQGKTYTARTDIGFEQTLLREKKVEREGDFLIGRYQLVLFDFNDSKLTQQHTDILEMVKNQLKPNSELTIIGYTDNIGAENLNQELSMARAQSVADYMKGYNIVDIKGMGESFEYYNNSSPEGRFYSRTVRIVSRTPIK
jgi:outer membrane protein OmpA-like peptidoglycan-associated protein